MTQHQLNIYRTYFDVYSIGFYYKQSFQRVTWTVYDFDSDDSDLDQYIFAKLLDNEISKYDRELFGKILRCTML